MPREHAQRPYWKNDFEWVCPKHLPTVVNRASQGQCSFHGCLATRPRLVQIIDPCMYEKCDTLEGMKGRKRSRSKYCSDECRKKQARLNYRRRNGSV